MQIEIIDRIAFSVVSNTCVKELVKVHPEWDERANLHRDKTLATGDPICDYLYTRPGSEIEKQWQAEHPEGSFNSK